MGSDSFMNSLNFGPLHYIVIGFFYLNWAIRSVRGIMTLGGPGIAYRSIFRFL